MSAQLQQKSSKPNSMASPAAAAGVTIGTSEDQHTPDLTAFVKSLLKEMEQRFQTMSDSIINRIDDMGSRIDDLEKSISELMEQAGVDEQPSAPAGAQK
ncbi:unnamed protein product [Vitrella brassicaformis CCMP3155]|uniref:Heat shock factor binding protein 1 n=1 Tax=Vitrella brassicaformis (strain CCMP3155) TaxID=1169540 RepID=A0A0G4G080_VITBC|nr:unnamed protein product [Vitrella brassicaformis CCMP3155]|mmetsp:Transcript_6778/g.16462  ORF Transcript_6778/g.16462 Transcript_6778/m.16462 type:complete len:99 (-) Transcript_6778:206-502(-)|eukprot:CEM21092.1 unnamed protein product [Vitrella brassicaformis CCMP3155]